MRTSRRSRTTSTLIRSRRVNHPLLDIRRERIKRFFDIDVALSGDFQKGNTQLVGELLTPRCRYRALFFPVAFVADEDLVHALCGVLFDVGEPCSDIYILLFTFSIDSDQSAISCGVKVNSIRSGSHPFVRWLVRR